MLQTLIELAESSGTEARRSIATALSAATDPKAEVALSSLLDETHVPVACAAARSLAARGSVNAVEKPLRRVESGAGAELRPTPRQGVSSIQSKVSGGAVGQLSLAAPSLADSLSTVDEHSGSISMGDEPKSTAAVRRAAES